MSDQTPGSVLRAVAGLLDANPDLPPPVVVTASSSVYWHLYSWEHEDIQAVAGLIRRRLGGRWKKTYDRDELVLRREQEGLKLTIAVKRDAVCTRRVVGTETVTLPAVEAQAERTEEREVIEWDCEPLLSKASA